MKQPSYIAMCPKCSARLPLEEEQMRQANGQVRCGICNHTFYAPDQLLKGFYTPQAKSQQASGNDLLFLPDDGTRSAAVATRQDPLQQQPQKQPLRPKLLDADQFVRSTPPQEREAESVRPSEQARQASKIVRAGAPSPQRPGKADVPSAEKTPDPPLTVDTNAQATATTPLSTERRRAAHTTPAMLNKTAEQRSGNLWLWWLGIVVLLVGLMATVFLAMFDTWSRHQVLRGVYAYVCPLLDCELPRDLTPVLMDVGAAGQIRLGPGSYQIQGAVLNHAFYPQPLPIIRLEFIDLQNKVHASQLFTPQQYAPGLTDLPAGKSQPFRLQVQLARPVQFHLAPRFVLVSY